MPGTMKSGVNRFRSFSIVSRGTAFILLLAFPLAGAAQAETKLIRLHDGLQPPQAVVSLISSGPGDQVVKASVSGLLSRRISTKEGEFEGLEIPGEGITAQVGSPRLPVIRRLVEVPLGASLRVELGPVDIQEKALEDLGLDGRIAPMQPPVPKIPGAGEEAPFVIDEQRYGTDAFWPPEVLQVREIGLMRQIRLAMVEIFPVRYNPSKGVVQLCTSVEFHISFPGADPARTRAHRERYGSLFLTRRGFQRLFIDSDPQPAPRRGWSTPPAGYLMVVADELVEAIAPLADWKRQQGFQVSLVKTSQAGSDKAEIQNYVRNAYETWDIPPAFLLLVGDVGQVPSFLAGGITTDLYYTTMSDGDYLPDIQVGRLAAPDSMQVAWVVDKILRHEKGLWAVTDQWTRQGYFMASNDSWYHEVAEGTQNYSMRLARSHGMICDSLYAYYGTGTPISVAVNQGRTMAVYSGHGSYYSWQGPSFTQNDVMALENGQMYPLVCSHACNTGDFSKAICYGETWLRTKDKGAAAFWGSSVSSYWEEDDVLQRLMFDALFDSSITWLSGMMDQAKLGLFLYYGGQGLSKSYYEQYNLLGDPSMHLWTRPPKSLRVSHPGELALGALSFTVNVWQPRAAGPDSQDAIKSTALIPVSDVMASLSMNGELAGTALSIDGEAVVLLEPPPREEGILEIGLSKPGYRPYLGFAEVVASGPYLLYQQHLLDDSAGGNGDGQANPGESFQLRVIIVNVGNENARGVTASLSTDDPYVDISETTSGFGDIPPDGSSLGLPAFQCDISEICPDDHQIAMTLTAEDSLGHRWLCDFHIQVLSPALGYHQHQIHDDPPGGNGNGVAEVGEILEIEASLCNDGAAMATGVTALLLSMDSHVQVLSDSAVYGDMPPGARASGDPPYQVMITGSGAEFISCPLLLQIAAEGGYSSSDTLVLLVGVPGFSDDMEAGVGNWTHAAIGAEYEDHWHLSGEKSHSGSWAWKCGDAGDGTYFHYEHGALMSPSILLGINSVLTFWHWMESEVYDATHAWDGGTVEISRDGGISWEPIVPVGGYPFTIWDNAPSAGSPFAADTPCFSGAHDWRQEQFDLSAYSGLVHLRFRFGSDQYTEREGWYLDDVQVGSAETWGSFISDLRIRPSNGHIHLSWEPSIPDDLTLEYEIYRGQQPGELVRADNLVAVVSEPWFRDDPGAVYDSGGHIFYSVVAVDVNGRRSSACGAVGWWSRPLKSDAAQ